MCVGIGHRAPWIQKHSDNCQQEKEDANGNSDAKDADLPECVSRESTHHRMISLSAPLEEASFFERICFPLYIKRLLFCVHGSYALYSMSKIT